jgi:hypothetical protein
MKFLRNRRRLTAVGAVVVAVAATLFVVLPAVASTAGDLVSPASGDGVMPLDVAFGGNGACSNIFTGANVLPAGVHEYDNSNPKTGTAKSGNNDGVTFNLTLHSPSNTSQTLDVQGNGAAILGIGIKGGSQTTAYNYQPTAKGFVMGDTGLHAPLQNNSYTTSNGIETGNSFYSISLLNVCYAAMSYIQGTVYQDTNQNGTNDDNSPRVGWTVNLYSGVKAGTKGGGTLIAHQLTGADGAYHFDIAATGTTYRVCEVPLAGDNPTNGAPNWVQDQPLPSTANLCTGSGELPKGYDFTPTSTAGASGDDFGNVGGYPCSSPGAQVGNGPYTVGTCKGGQEYVFNAGTTQAGAPYIDYWVGDPSQANVPTVEQINFDDPIVNGSPKYTKLLYADGGGFPPNLNNLLTMPYCLLDPRSPANTDTYVLASTYTDVNNAGQVIPNFSVANNQTSCVISIKVTAPQVAGNPGKLQAYVYALGDPVRGVG